jgi:hypothetical protein
MESLPGLPKQRTKRTEQAFSLFEPSFICRDFRKLLPGKTGASLLAFLSTFSPQISVG